MVLAFHQHADFFGERGSPVIRPRPSARVHLQVAAPDRRRLLEYFDEVVFDRHGVLQGDYILLENGLGLVSRDGEIIRINSSADEASAAAIDQYYASPGLGARLADLLLQWDDLPLVTGLPCLAEPYCGNYYHFSLDLIPRLRFFERADNGFVGLPLVGLSAVFQRSLLARTLGERTLLPVAGPMRVRHPWLAHGITSQASVAWLRGRLGATRGGGSRRIYIHRAGSITRQPPGGGIVEDADFLALLDRFGFETIDFGAGEREVPAQIARLENAGLILAAHGAGLTNLAYLHPPLTVIEIFSSQRIFAGFLHIADSLGFTYHGLLFEATDDTKDIVVDCTKLTELLLNL